MASVKLRQCLSLGQKCLNKEAEKASCRKIALIQDDQAEKKQQHVARSSKHTGYKGTFPCVVYPAAGQGKEKVEEKFNRKLVFL